MVDIHTHILPGIDDGASSMEEALSMLNLMVENGVTTVVATPHFSFDECNINEFIIKRESSLSDLKNLVRELNLPIRILGGSELMFTPNLDNYNLEDLVIEGTDYVLIELSTRKNEPELENTLLSIIVAGYIPILAHIERYSYLIQDSQRLVELISMGVLMQVNASSLNSKDKYPFIDKLMKNNLVHVISSDSHDISKRKPNLRLTEIALSYVENQKRIVENLIVPISKPRKLRRIFNVYI